MSTTIETCFGANEQWTDNQKTIYDLISYQFFQYASKIDELVSQFKLDKDFIYEQALKFPDDISLYLELKDLDYSTTHIDGLDPVINPQSSAHSEGKQTSETWRSHHELLEVDLPSTDLNDTEDPAANAMDYVLREQHIQFEGPTTALGCSNSTLGSLATMKSLGNTSCGQPNKWMWIHSDVNNFLPSTQRQGPDHQSASKRDLSQDTASMSRIHNNVPKRLKTLHNVQDATLPIQSSFSGPSFQEPVKVNRSRVRKPIQGADTSSIADLCFSIVDDMQFRNLKLLISKIRSSAMVHINYNARDLNEICNTLAQEEWGQQLTTFQHRILLRRFAIVRDQLLEDTRLRRKDQSDQPKQAGMRKVESEVKDIITKKIYPHTYQEGIATDIPGWRNLYKGERHNVENYTQAAKFWKEAVENFGLGILLLIPSVGHLSRKSSRYERLQDESRALLFTALGKQDNGCLTRASALLSPFVQAFYDGREYSTKLYIELIDAASLNMIDQDRVLSLLREVGGDKDGHAP